MISWIFRPSRSSINESRSTRPQPSSMERWRATLDFPTPMKPVSATRVPLFVNDNILKNFKKAWKRNVHTFGADYLCFAFFRKQTGDRERHRDPMITERINPRSFQIRPADPESIIEFLDVRTHSAEIFDNRRDPVGLFHPKLACIPDLESVRKPRPE